MNKIRVTAGCFVALFIFGVAFPTSAQVATGTPPFGSYGGGPDVINLANLNSHLTIPILQKAGRGMGFSYALTYDSSVWTPVTSGGTTTWVPAATWGWGADTQVATGYLSANKTTGAECGYFNTKGFWIHTGYEYGYSNWAYVDKFAQSHPFTGTTLSSGPHCDDPATSLNTPSADGSGYTIQATGGAGTVFARNGAVIVPQTNLTSGAATKTDTNGNQISVDNSGNFTDTLGIQVLTVTGSAPNPKLMTYAAPSNPSASYTMKYTSFTVQTYFQCTGVSEYSAVNVPLVSEIDLPDSTKYTFSYEATPGHSGNVTGRLASVTLPAGGTINYTYSGGSNGITCADGSTATLGRQTPDGSWSYAHSETGTAWTDSITDPQGNVTKIYSQGIYATESDVYQGAVLPANLLRTTFTCYNGNTVNCNSTAVTLPITQQTVTMQLPGTTPKQTKVSTTYNSLGLVTERDDYDYGNNGAPSSTPLRKTVINYANLGSNIADRRATILVTDGNGVIKGQTTIGYDETAVTATSNTPQHVAVGTARGNPTSVTLLTQFSATLQKIFTYYDTGTILTAKDVNGATTTYVYGTGTASCGNSFPTSLNLPMSLTRSMTWTCTGGLMTSFTDENNKLTSIAYTPDSDFWRVNSITDPATNVTTYHYSGANSIESSLPFNGSTSTLDSLQTLDGLGRTHIAQIKQSPSSTNYDSVETDYDIAGRPSRVTVPYSGGAGVTKSTGPATTAVYDGLSRPTLTTDGGGGTVTLAYIQNDVLRTLGPAPSGENSKRKQFEYDGLGRLTSVCEITSATGSGSCAQTSAATGYWTQYTYDPIGDLARVIQNAQSSTTQTRTYSYDGLGRMTQEINPESGTTTYVYDTDSTCGGTYNGDLVKKIDFVGNVTCFTYDALHRPLSVIVMSGSYAASTPKKYFVYDLATVNGVAMVNVKSRLAEAYTSASTCPPPCSSKLTDIGFSYAARGEVSDVYESTPNSGGYYHVSATYWANGAVNLLSGLTGVPSITYTPDGEGRINSVSTSSGQNPVTSTSYNVASSPLQVNLGSLDSDSFIYDPNTNRMTQYKFTVNGQSVIGNLGWNAIGTLATLGITDPFNSIDTQNCTYAHDDLVRITSANCGTPWSQTFNYTADTANAFGNLNKSGTSQFQATYSPSTNRMTLIGSSTPSYDLNGNVLNDFLHTYTWNANGRPVTIDAVAVTYDALGRMVEQNRSGVYSQIVYAPTGSKLAIMTGQTLQKGFVSLPAGSMAVYNSNGLAYYRHSDWLGSSRLGSTPSRAVNSTTAYGPFGEAYSQSGTSDPSFTGQNQDTVSNLYDFPAREYGIQGRWPSPDPAGLAAVHLSDPQTLNRYAYVRNSPLHLVDPLGLDDCLFCGGDGGGGGGCELCGDPPSGGHPDTCDTFCGPGGDFGGGSFSGAPAAPPIALPGQPLPGATPSTFPTGPGVDWTSVLFGPPDPSLMVFNWGENACPTVWPFSTWCENAILKNNREADQRIYNATDPFWDPFAMAFKRNGAILAQVHSLATTNLYADKALILGEFGSILADQPWLAKFAQDQWAGLVSGIRDQNNQKIDWLLGLAGLEAAGRNH